MGVVTVRPTATIAATGWTVTGATAHAALSDDSDDTYVSNDSPTSGDLSPLAVLMGAPTIPAGSRIVGVRLRRRWSVDSSADPGLLRHKLQPDGGSQWLTWDRPTFTSDESAGIVDSQSRWWAERPTGGVWTETDVATLAVASGTSEVSVRLYELFADIEYNEPPVVTVDGPSSPVTDTTRPTVTWGYTDADGDLQDAYQIRLFTADQEPSGGWPADPADIVGTPVWTSGTVLSSGSSRQIPSNLVNGETYRVYVRARQGLYSLWSQWDHAGFTIDLDGPDAPTVTVVAEPDKARFRLEVADAGTSSPPADWFDVEWSDGDGWEPLRHGRDIPVVGEVPYWEGAGADDWVAGISNNSGARSKEVDHLAVEAEVTSAGSASGADWAWVTDVAVDLSGVGELRVDWAAQFDTSAGRVVLAVSTSKSGRATDVAKSLEVAGPTNFARRVETLDVSGLSGLHFIRVHAVAATSGDANPRLQVYGLGFDQDPGPNPPSILYDHEAPLQAPRQYRVRGVADVAGLAGAGEPTVTVPFSLGAPGRWLTDVDDPGRLHLRLSETGHRRRQQGRDAIHRPVGMDVVVVESEPPTYAHDIEAITRNPEQEAQLREAVRSRRPLLFRDRRQSVHVRIVGEVGHGQSGADVLEVDRWSLSTVEVPPPAI